MRAEFTASIGGERVRFALPIGGIERLALYEPCPFVLWERLRDGCRDARRLDYRDVRAVLDAACGEDVAERVVEEAGVIGAGALAARILTLALTDDAPEAEPGKPEAEPVKSPSWFGRIWSWAARWGGPRQKSAAPA